MQAKVARCKTISVDVNKSWSCSEPNESVSHLITDSCGYRRRYQGFVSNPRPNDHTHLTQFDAPKKANTRFLGGTAQQHALCENMYTQEPNYTCVRQHCANLDVAGDDTLLTVSVRTSRLMLLNFSRSSQQNLLVVDMFVSTRNKRRTAAETCVVLSDSGQSTLAPTSAPWAPLDVVFSEHSTVLYVQWM